MKTSKEKNVEKLYIKNFLGITESEVEFKKITVLIGQQAAGKSVTAKLFYFFKSFAEKFKYGILNNISLQEIESDFLNSFCSIFSFDSQSQNKFEIKYTYGDYFVIITKKTKLSLVYNPTLKNIKSDFRKISKLIKPPKEKTLKIKEFEFENTLEIQRDNILSQIMNEELGENILSEQIFIPASRSFFTHIDNNIYFLIDNKVNLDKFVIDFGKFYKRMKNDINKCNTNKCKQFVDIIEEILDGEYIIDNNFEGLLLKDKRKIPLLYASSGQQEILPLLNILRVFYDYLSDFEIPFTFYIEEPEAHLYPNAQRLVIRLLALFFHKINVSIIITTHSPYILSSLNNLMYAGDLAYNYDKKDEVIKIVDEKELINPNDVAAYSLHKDKPIKNLINDKTKLIADNALDDVSNEIADEFDQLLDIED